MYLEHLKTDIVNLTNCDREPIHIPGAIQPHGVLFVLSEVELRIQLVSDNTHSILNIKPLELLGQSLSNFLDSQQVETLRNCLQGDFENINPVQLTFYTHQGALTFDGIIHRTPQNKIILELEPFENKASFNNLYKLVKNTLAKIQQVVNLAEVATLVATEVRKLTGFERVMIYKFAPDGSGMVIAEDKLDQLDSYKGLHYPDSDIPLQAKYLYSINWLRLIPDVNYQKALLICDENSRELEPLDLSFSVLRSVSPIHIEYLKNMGVAASLSISLIKNQKLWGLISCHHSAPFFVPYEIRTACEFLGQVMSIHLSSLEAQEHLDLKIHLKTIQSKFIESISSNSDFTEALINHSADLLDLVGASGAVICNNGVLTTVGKTPSEDDIYNLIDWLKDKFENNLFVTDSLPKIYPVAESFSDIASGLLALSITKIAPNYVLWFRPEIIRQVNWAGNPDKPKRLEADGTLTIFPRQSFQVWQETVRNKSIPWQPWEIEGAFELRSAIVSIILRKADELAALNLELQRSNNELDAFAYIASHDLKEPLRGIHNYSNFLLEDYGEILNQDGVNKLETLVNLTKKMENLINSLLHFSRLGRQELVLTTLDINIVIQSVIEIFKISYKDSEIEIKITGEMPNILGDRVMIEEVFTNLISNAVKYNDRIKKVIEIGCFNNKTEENFYTFYIKDNGIGIQEQHLNTIFRIFKRLHASGKYGGGTGAGLTIVKKIIERHGGKIWVESTYGQGSIFYFTLKAIEVNL